MRKLLTLLFIALGLQLASCNNSNTKTINASEVVNNPYTASNPSATKMPRMPKIVFEHKEFNFGKVNDGAKVEHVYKFKNEGEAPLLIQYASASCGCTVPTYPKEPIAPGGTGEIKVVFNSSGRVGKATKSVSVNANTNPSVTDLILTGEVLSTPDKGPFATPGMTE